MGTINKITGPYHVASGSETNAIMRHGERRCIPIKVSLVQKHSQGPKQVAGVPPLQAICEE